MTFEEIEKRMIKQHELNEKLFKALKPAFEAVFEAGKDSALTELNNQGGKMMHEKLLPCPFCGKEAKIITGYNNGAYFSIVCTGCHVSLCQRSYDNSFQPSETKDGKKAILDWNTRTYSQENEKQKTACISFFEWWMSNPGEDISQGYDEWKAEQFA